MPYDKLDGRKLKVAPISKRKSYIEIETTAVDPIATPPKITSPVLQKQMDALRERIIAARNSGASVMLAYGAHLIKNGGGLLVKWLVENGWVTHVATQGAGIIHDWEFSFCGVSSESVKDNAPVGKFGSWDETGFAVNLAALAAGAEGIGLGESIGKLIAEDGLTLPDPQTLAKQISDAPCDELTAGRADLLQLMETFDIPGGKLHLKHPNKKYSVPAACYNAKVPMTVHPGIGYDIYVNHPMFSGAGIGRSSGTDARIFANSCLNLTGGVYLSVGSAIMSPQVFEKAFSAANNILQQQNKPFIHDHYIGIVDIQDGGDWDWTAGEPPKDHPAYYLRFCKSFYRMGGTVDYLCDDNRVILANLISQLNS
ncbi:MAG: hypothetical protein KAR11_04915 [Phycisphaerae bacterium]|nr:hypothetical protein [Phycisphaerae bacterium]